MPACRWITLEELDDRRAEWRRLAATGVFPSAFADPAWVLAWWRSYGTGREPWSFALEDRAGSLRGLALLARKASSSARTLTFAGESWNGLETLLCSPDAEAELCALLLEALAERRHEWDVWRIQRLPGSSLLARRLRDGSGHLRAAAHDVRLQPFLALPDDVQGFEANFGAKQRGTLRRKWKRLLELGAEPRLVDDPDEIGAALKVLLDLRRARAIAHRQRHRHMDARFERFLHETVRDLLPEGARLWRLEAAGAVLATHLNFVEGPREHSYLLGLSEMHTNLSPGISLEHHAIRAAIGEGRTELDLGPGRDVYKYRLGALDRELMRMVVSSGSARGRLLAGLLAGDLRLRNTAAADALRRRRGLMPAGATSRSPTRPG